MGGGMVSSSINSYKTIHHHRHHKKIENRIKPPSKNEWKANKITPIPQDESDSEDNALSMQLLFESNSAELTEAVQEQLKPVGKALASDTSDAKFIIEGHTDAAGDDFYNKVLSQKRAESVKSYFVAAGVNPSRFTTVGKGKSNLFDSSNPTSQLNRRVRLIAVK
jgi:outer membrane protein OmpA-like peptidoglycan-associated protein